MCQLSKCLERPERVDGTTLSMTAAARATAAKNGSQEQWMAIQKVKAITKTCTGLCSSLSTFVVDYIIMSKYELVYVLGSCFLFILHIVHILCFLLLWLHHSHCTHESHLQSDKSWTWTTDCIPHLGLCHNCTNMYICVCLGRGHFGGLVICRTWQKTHTDSWQ